MMQDNDDRLDLHFLAVRQGVGLLGLILPTVLFLYGQSNPIRMQPSISEFYYTAMGDFFVGSLVAIGIFLITYRGYTKRPERFWLGDREMSIIAGVAAIGVALIPAGDTVGFALCLGTDGARVPCTAVPDPTLLTGLHYISDSQNWLISRLHFISAGIFFLALAYFCLVLFPMGGKRRADGSAAMSMEHLIYRVCGIVLLLSIAGILLGNLISALAFPNFVFWWETAGVYAFAIAWLTKGKALTRPLGFRMPARS